MGDAHRPTASETSGLGDAGTQGRTAPRSGARAARRAALRDRAVETANEVGARVLHLTERAVVRASLVPATPFLPTATLDWIPALEADWKTIRAELDEVLSYRNELPNFQDISIDQ